MLAFSEFRFNTNIRYGTIGGPEYSTEITTVTSGAEQRNANWIDSRGKWQIADDVYNSAEIAALIAFFHERMGRAGGFRFKDWSDWRVTSTDGVLTAIAGSTTTMQLQKKYVNGSNVVYRDIKKPVPGTVIVYSGGSPVSATVDYTTGIVTIGAGTYTWAGEFDVPARFDTDTFQSEFVAYRDSDKEAMYRVTGLTIVETR